ncbi:MAG: metal ABC transporter substrate-binding protein [Nitrospinaceae bacterium]
MKIHSCLTLITISILCLWINESTAAAKLRVVTTTQDIAALVKEVGGDLVKVESIARGYQDAHYIEARPSYMLKVNRADLLIYQGLELEIGWLPLLIQGGRNLKVLPGRPGNLDLSSSILPLEIPRGEVDRSMGDIHPLGNPHYHLDPENGVFMAQAIADRLEDLDAENAGTYRDRLGHFIERLTKKIEGWKKRLEKFRSPKVVTYHKTWSYFLKRFGITRVGTIEPIPGVPPTPRHLTTLAKLMKNQHTRVILQANYFETKFSGMLAQKTGAVVLSLPVSVGGAAEAADYISLFDTLVTSLENGLSNP